MKREYTENEAAKIDSIGTVMKEQLPYIAFSVFLVASFHYLLDLPLGYTALAIFVGWPLIGTLVTADDDLPGGWSNPDGTVTPPWRILENWGPISIRAALAALAFVIEAISARLSFWFPMICVVFFMSLGFLLMSGPWKRHSTDN